MSGLPDLNQVRYAISSIVKTFDSFLEWFSTEKSPTFGDYRNRLHSNIMELTRIYEEVRWLATTHNRKYEKAYDELRKSLLNLISDVSDIEEKHKSESIFWEGALQEGGMRKELIKLFKGVSKRLKKIQKEIQS